MPKQIYPILQADNRFIDLVHYVLWYCKTYHQRKALGKVKLNKILWAIHMHHMCRTGRSRSGETASLKQPLGRRHRFLEAAAQE